MASYLIRSLLFEGKIRSETVEKTVEGMRPRFIEREGPTGLVITITSIRLRPENKTRMFSLLAAEYPAQTSTVMAAMAKRHAGDLPAPTDFEPWHALQRSLARGDVAVTISFAEAIAAAIPPFAVRLRRDFGSVLSVIQAHALLHRASRKRNARGEMKDFRSVYDLILADGLGVTVTHSMRETVQAVHVIAAQKGTASMTDVAEALGNEEPQPRRKARLVLGTNLPQDHSVLPPLTCLQVCSVNGKKP